MAALGASSRVEYDAGWRRHIGCLKSRGIFRKRATNNRALLRKTTCKDKASYGSSPPCTSHNISYLIESCHILKESCLQIEGVMQCTSEMKKSCHTLKESCDAGHVDGSAGCIGEC